MAYPHWILYTGGDVEKRVQDFLAGLWNLAKLDGMVVPVYGTEVNTTGPKLLGSINELQNADPFIPFMPLNTAKVVENITHQYPSSSFAAVLRSCETRALAARMQRNSLNLANWLVIGVDCLASFSGEDYIWRVERAGDAHKLTQQVLRNARQGGISLDRFRSSCQMCILPGAQVADICINIAGLPIKQYVLVTLHTLEIAQRVDLCKITEGIAPGWLVEQHENVLDTMIERNKHIKQRLLSELQSSLPQDLDSWIQHLENCVGCESCLDACPLYVGQLQIGMDAVADWLTSCVACGMCEQACPKQFPLTAVIRRIVERTREELVPA